MAEATRLSRLPRGSYRGEAQPVETVDYLGFRLKDEDYALPLGFVHEILKVPSITDVPRAPSDILGIISLRGTVVTVIDLRRRVGLLETPFDRRTRVLIVEREGEPMGLVVDAVVGVVRFLRAEIEEAPAIVGARHGEFLAGVGRKSGEMFVLLDLRAVLQGILMAARHENVSKNMVGFLVGETHYAVDILRVREIVNPISLVSVPHCPPFVVGVADHRGQTIPLVDLHRRFGLPDAEVTRRTKWIIADLAGLDVGLWVDGVTSVFGVSPADVRPPPDLAVTAAARFIAGVALYEGALVFLLDLDQIAEPGVLAAPLAELP